MGINQGFYLGHLVGWALGDEVGTDGHSCFRCLKSLEE